MSDAPKAKSRLPRPQEWEPRRPRKLMLASGFLGLLSVGSLGLALLALREEPPVAAFLLALAVFLGLITAHSVTLLRHRAASPRTITLSATGAREGGIRMPYSRSAGYSLALVTLLTAVFAGGFVIVALVEAPSPRAEDWPKWLPLLFLAAIALFVLGFLIDLVRGLVAGGAVILDPAGIHHRSWTFEHFAPWESLHRVMARQDERGLPEIVVFAHHTPQTRVRKTGWLWKQSEFRSLPDVEVAARWLAVDPAVLYHAIRFYHTHPEARAELVTDTGLHRIQHGHLMD